MEWENVEYKTFTEADYKELQKNLILYKQGDREASTYICTVFQPFLRMYANFLAYGKLPCSMYTDKNGVQRRKVESSISSFISLYYSKDDKNESRPKAFSNTCTRLKSLFEKYEYDDIYNQLVLALLNMANKYKITQPGDRYHKENGTFHMYVKKAFHWEARSFFRDMIKDPLVGFNVMQLVDQFDDLDMDSEDVHNQYVLIDDKSEDYFNKALETATREHQIKTSTKLTLREDNMDPYDEDSLNFNWTNGVTCGVMFKNLSSYEREIIIMYYMRNMSDEVIGNMYGKSRVTIRKHRLTAIERIQDAAARNNLIGDD